MAATNFKNDFLLISLDPGYDGFKVVVGGLVFHVPNSFTEHIEGGRQQILSLDGANVDKKDLLVAHGLTEGKEFVGGLYARNEQMEPGQREKYKEIVGAEESYERFKSANFAYLSAMVIAKGLIKYAELSDRMRWKTGLSIVKEEKDGKEVRRISGLDKIMLCLEVELPEQVTSGEEDMSAEVIKALSGQRKFTLENGNDFYEIDYCIEKDNIEVISQVIAAYLGAATNDDGVWNKESKAATNLPVLVIDAGRRTDGIFLVGSNFNITGAESNRNFAMANVYKNVSKRIKEQYNREIEHFEIPNYLDSKRDGKLRVLDKDGKQRNIDIKGIVAEETNEMCKGLIEYLKKKFNDLMDVNHILITGGTGKAFYLGFKNYVDENFEEGVMDVSLTDYKFMGENIEPVFAIAVGGYKVRLHKLHRLAKIAEKQIKEESN